MMLCLPLVHGLIMSEPAIEEIPNDAGAIDPMAPPQQAGSAAPLPTGRSRAVRLDNEIHYAQEELQNALVRASMLGQLSTEQSAALEAAAQAGEKLVKIATHMARRRCRVHRQRAAELLQLESGVLNKAPDGRRRV